MLLYPSSPPSSSPHGRGFINAAITALVIPCSLNASSVSWDVEARESWGVWDFVPGSLEDYYVTNFNFTLQLAIEVNILFVAF
jgi:hypothetical protein